MNRHRLEMIGSSQAMRTVRELVAKAAACDVPVLITGESGVGKELVARAVHLFGPRRDRPFVDLNCSALAEGILESELFGHARGAFTGAVRDRIGLFEAANGGTIFLDEIGEMPLRMQAKLLRVLQNREVRRLGEESSRCADFRLVAATNVDLERKIETGRFRRDLYFRINVVEIRVPPLRARTSDIPELIEYFYRRKGLCAPRLIEEAADLLFGYPWPGNVRELENEVERLIALNGVHGSLEPAMLSSRIRNHGKSSEKLDFDLLCDGPLELALVKLERVLLAQALRATGGNKSRAARRLGISRQGLLKKLKRYGMYTDGNSHQSSRP